MRKTTAFLFLAFLILFFSSNKDFAQFRLSLGPATGLNFNLHTGSDLDETGTGFGLVIGGSVDMEFTNTIGLVTNLQFYDNRSGSSTDESTQNLNDGTPVNVSEESSIGLAYLMIEPLFKLSLPNSGFYFVMGPSLGFNIEGSIEQTNTFTLTQGQTWQETGTNKLTRESKGSLDDLLVRFELKLGAGYDIPVGTSISLFPQVTFGYGITKVQEDVSWRILTVQALFGVKFRLI